MNTGITEDDITWVVIVDGEVCHEATTKDTAREWAETQEIEPDRIASKSQLKTPFHL